MPDIDGIAVISYGATGRPDLRPGVATTGQDLASHPTATFAGLAQVQNQRAVTVLDVRRTGEFGAARIPGAVNIPLHELPSRMGEVWVHCAAGYRASVAVSFLAAAGREPVAIDDDVFGSAQQAGRPVVAPDAG